MRAILFKYSLVLFMILMSGGLLMNVSHRVQLVEREIRSYDRKISAEREGIRVLKAEWAYLNTPDRLEELAKENLNLISPEAAQLVSDVDVVLDDPSLSPVFTDSQSPLQRDVSYSSPTIHYSKAISADYSPNSDKKHHPSGDNREGR